MSKYLKFIFSLLIISALLIVTAAISYQAGFQKGFTAPLAQLKPTEVFSLIGQIKSISGNAIILEVPVLVADNPLEIGQRAETRKVLISKETNIVETIVKPISPDITVLLEDKAPLAEEKAVTFANLQVGDQVEVFARENILAKKEFAATKVSRLISVIAMP